MENKYKSCLLLYNKLEKLFKVSQIVQQVFEIPVLNEYRYISRALVDYNLSDTIEKKEKALSRLEVGIAAAYNDIIDSIIMTIKLSIKDFIIEYPSVNTHTILKKYDHQSVLDAIKAAETVVIDSRADRSNRFDVYETFSNSDHYKTIINFCNKLPMIEYEFHSTANLSAYAKEEYITNAIKASFENTDNFLFPYFELVYQPKYSSERKIIGAEALIRIKMSDSHVLAPIAFLDTINQSDLELDLDLFVLKNVAQDIKNLKNIPNTFDISINAMPSTISNHFYIESFNETIKEYNIEHLLSIEIIETWNQNEEDEHIKTHYRLGELNSKTKVAIDDFGSGTTMLEYIVMISNLHTIKIDKILIDKLETKNDFKAKKLIEGICNLAEKAGLEIIVEGIETEKQFQYLTDIGIKKFQGYLLDKPMSLENLQKKINSSYL